MCVSMANAHGGSTEGYRGMDDTVVVGTPDTANGALDSMLRQVALRDTEG